MLSVQTREVKTEVLVNCLRCHDLFSLDVALSGRRILKYDLHPHIIVHNHSRYEIPKCHCGGDLKFVLVNKMIFF